MSATWLYACNLLSDCGVGEMRKLRLIPGVAILSVGVVAGGAMWFALTSVLRINSFAAAALALLCGLTVIGIERWLVTSAFAPSLRVLLALLLGFVIAVPLVLRVFDPEISHKIMMARQQRASAVSAQIGDAGKHVAYWNAQVTGLQKTIKAGEPLATDRSLANLMLQQDAALSGVQQTLAGSDDAESQAALSQLASVSTQIQLHEGQLSVQQVQYQHAVFALPGAIHHLKAAQQQQKALQADLVTVTQARADLAAELHTLAQLTGADALGVAIVLTFLVIMLAESLPVSVTLLRPALAYQAIPAGAAAGLPTVARRRAGRSIDAQARPDPPAVAASAALPVPVPPAQRYLEGQCPDTVAVGKPFSLLVSVVLVGPDHAALDRFDVPPGGTDVLLSLHAPGLRLLSDQRQTVHVPENADSRPVMFELRADEPGPRTVFITAWLGGTYLGQLEVAVSAERGNPAAPHRDVRAEIATEFVRGAVSLVVRYDSVQNSYRFEFRDEDNPGEVTSKLTHEPGPLVEELVAGLDRLAKGYSRYSAGETRDYLINAGAALWQELVPEGLRRQFWERQDRITQLTILTDKDVVPWELLYPKDRGHDEGFLVEQFPVTRGIFGRRPARRLSWQARFVLPDGSLAEARAEINAMRRLLAPGQAAAEVISALTPLQKLIRSGDFGLLHFACHNRFDPAAGSSITLDGAQFTPMLMTMAGVEHPLERAAPTIFMNACRSAGVNPTYTRLDGWASKFLEAGAAAFVGSLWSVTDGTAREFATEFYSQLQAGFPLGQAMTRARQAAASQPDDPTWLAYTAYGDPRATVGSR